jgi:cyclopropane fatty-acyl-phospholipid synthase-like methyltransferase
MKLKRLLRWKFFNEDIFIRKMAIKYINTVRRKNLVCFYQPTYNPNSYYLYDEGENVRKETDVRLESMTKSLDFSKINSYLDIGSQFGYFVFKLAEKYPIIAHGIEVDKISYKYSAALTILNDCKRVSFNNLHLTPESAEKLPQYDLISFLNVFHHIVHFDNYDTACKVMQILSTKCKFFVFETGQYNEKGYYWSEDLKFMGDNPDKWVKEYLVSLGYRIISVNNFSTHLSENTRSFICGERQ